MKQTEQRALTYSLLAHIRNKGQLVAGPVQIFVPLIKRVLSRLNEKGIYSGKSITEIKQEADSLYSIDFPIPVLRTILSKIAKEINSNGNKYFELFQDDSFQIRDYAFTEFEETLRLQKIEIDNLEKLFKDFCLTCGNEKPEEFSILEFIEKNKASLSKYLAHKSNDNGKDYSLEAQFVDFFKQIPTVYDSIRKIYLGSILVSYIEYKTEAVKVNIELLIDTNFFLGLLDLNTPESTHTCRKIIEITNKQGYKLSILQDTINETITLLKAKAENFNATFLQKKIYPEDIYNACDRRNLNKVDLERIADNLEKPIYDMGITVVYDTTKYKNLAKFSKEFETLKKHRQTEQSALHDATALYYVRQKRGKYIKEFENVNCWFINNSISRDKYTDSERGVNNGNQPETIKADDFLNILWLSSPQVSSNIETNEIVDIGLTSLVSIGLNSTLPKLSVIRELDDNIHKYAQDNGLTDQDIIRVATRITTKQLTDVDSLNKIAKEDKEKFVKRLSEEASKQKELDDERIKRLDKVLQNFATKADAINKIKDDFEKKSKSLDEKFNISTIELDKKEEQIVALKLQLDQERKERVKEENNRRAELREDLVKNELKKWRKTICKDLLIWGFLLIASIIFLLWNCSWEISCIPQTFLNYKENIFIIFLLFILNAIFTGITVKKWYDMNHNYSNIENYKKTIKIPDNLNDI